ncbi:MAG: DNA polymerase I [Candidatus Nanosynbacter sp.]|nr:DNA polymerase I [Candidatus Nanosynbacter sp.]
MAKRLVIIDGKSVFYRGYYAMPGLSTADGTPTGGVYGFAALSLELIKQLNPDYVCVAWDKRGTNIRRRLAIYPDYKAGRKPAPPDFYAQIPILHELLAAFSWPLYEFDDYEADDIMATLDKQAEQHGDIETYLITSDLDALQILDQNTYLYALKKGLTNIDKFDIPAFEKRYGIRIGQFLDLKSLKGDSSDNIPGVPGVGEKTAVKLLQQFETLDGVYENLWQIKDSLRRKLETGKKSAYMSRELARLFTDAPVKLDLEAMNVRDLDTAKLRELLEKLEFRSLLRKLPQHMRDSASEVTSNNILAPAVEILGDKVMPMLVMAPELLVIWDGDMVWLSHEKGKVARLPLAKASAILAEASIVGHDTKEFFKALLGAGCQQLPAVKHDTAQGSFLLNPLRKSRALADLAGVESLDDPRLAMAALWVVYEQQKSAFAELPDLQQVAQTMDFPLINVLAQMEFRGIKIDASKLEKMNKSLAQEIAAVQQNIYDMVGYEFNVASPAQLASALFDKLLLPIAGIKKGKTGYSTNQKELDKLRGQHPIIELVERFRELSKLQNTYVAALPEQTDANGYIHTTFNQDVTATGRLSSTNPNLQNIPIRTELGRQIRDAFVPASGNVFVNADYSQFELRLAAVMAGEKQMIEDFNTDVDIHAKTAAEVYNVPINEVTPTQRRCAKVVNFGVLYGMSQHGLAAAANMSYGEAQHFIDEYYRIHPRIKEFMERTIRQAHEDGFVQTLFGRRRPTPDVRSNNFAVRSAAERAAANMPIQGTEADLMKLAMLAVEKRLTTMTSPDLLPSETGKFEKNEFALPERQVSSGSKSGLVHKNISLGHQILQIHDSIMVECPRQNAEIVSKMLVETMENIHPQLGIKLKVDVKIGNNWGEV